MAETFTRSRRRHHLLAVLAADNTKPLTSLAPVVEMTSHFTLTERVHSFHTGKCPVARSIGGSIAISAEFATVQQ